MTFLSSVWKYGFKIIILIIHLFLYSVVSLKTQQRYKKLIMLLLVVLISQKRKVSKNNKFDIINLTMSVTQNVRQLV